MKSEFITSLREDIEIIESKLCARGKAAAKAKFDVYPSAYANGYAVQVCKGTKPGLDGKKKAASGYKKSKGKPKSEELMREMESTFESLDRWFKEKWVDVSKKNKDGKHPPCGRVDKDGDGKKDGAYPKCRPSKKVSSKTPKTSSSYSKKQKKNMTSGKRDAEKKSGKSGKGNKPTMHKYKPKKK